MNTRKREPGQSVPPEAMTPEGQLSDAGISEGGDPRTVISMLRDLSAARESAKHYRDRSVELRRMSIEYFLQGWDTFAQELDLLADIAERAWLAESRVEG